MMMQCLNWVDEACFVILKQYNIARWRACESGMLIGLAVDVADQSRRWLVMPGDWGLCGCSASVPLELWIQFY